jgi:UDP-N-acetylmuramyl pentapeptide phosphotransferase/UDP-N-acetylglucosamine-1-phosphate transferase
MLFFLILFILNITLIICFDKFSRFVNLFDIPDGLRKLHKQPIASIGGVIIFINLLFYFIYTQYRYFNFNIDNSYFTNFDFIIFFITASIFFFIGYFDDKFNLNPNLKLLLFSLIIFILLSLSDNLAFNYLKFSFLKIPINIEFIYIPFMILCITLYLCAFNMFDGINLQSSLYSLCIFFIFILQGIFIEISLIIILSLLSFCYLNHKNKCFLGDNGSLLIAFIVSYLFIKSQSFTHFFADEIFLAMQLPGLDLLRLAIQRMYNKKHPFHPDSNHIHHILLKRVGYPKTILIISATIMVPNFFSVLFGQTLYCIILTFFIYFFLILKFNNFNKKIYK